MNCDEAEILLHALIDGELDAGHAREVESHIAGCPRCAAALRDYREMSKAIAEAGAGYTAPAALRQRIEAALAQSSGKVSGAHGAAAKLGIPASTLESKIRSLRINKFQFKGV